MNGERELLTCTLTSPFSPSSMAGGCPTKRDRGPPFSRAMQAPEVGPATIRHLLHDLSHKGLSQECLTQCTLFIVSISNIYIHQYKEQVSTDLGSSACAVSDKWPLSFSSMSNLSPLINNSSLSTTADFGDKESWADVSSSTSLGRSASSHRSSSSTISEGHRVRYK